MELGNIICMGKKAIVEIWLVPESRITDDEQLEKQIKETLQCSWLLQVEKVTIHVHKP
jgi:hypothetical protein